MYNLTKIIVNLFVKIYYWDNKKKIKSLINLTLFLNCFNINFGYGAGAS